MKKGYCCLNVDLSSSIAIKNAIDKFGLNPFPYYPITYHHCTLMYDKTNPDIDPGVNKNSYTAKIIGVDELGDDSVVLLLESEEIKKRFNELIQLGFKHSFDDILLHVTIGNSKDKDVLNAMLDHAKNILKSGYFPKEILLVRETWEEIDNDKL